MASLAELGFNIPFMKEIVASIAGIATFAFTIYSLGRRAGNKGDRTTIASLRRQIDKQESDRAGLAARLLELENTVKDPRDFWLRSPSKELVAGHLTEVNSSVPIISILNFKGGVGKTTICANLAAHFAERGKRVLLVDFDYQGSLSDTVLTHARVDDFKANSYMLLEGGREPMEVRAAAERLSSIDSRMWIYPAFYDFSRTEIRMMFRWLIGQDDEIRYNLSHYLQSPAFKDNAETAFDMVLIDAPPRLLTGVVNALVASTHVLIPTILDGQSHIATLNTVMAIQQFRQKLNPSLRLLGIVPSLVATATAYNERERHFLEQLERQLGELGDGPVPILKSRPIWRREELAKAGGSEILYRREGANGTIREIRAMFDNLGDYIDQNVRWRSPINSEERIILPGLSKARAI